MHAPPLPKHGCPTSKRCSRTSGSNGTAGSSRRNGWRHSRSRISGRNPHPRSLQSWRRMLPAPTGHLLFLWVVGLLCGGVLLSNMTIITLTLGLMVTLGSVFITGIVASRHQLKYESFYLED